MAENILCASGVSFPEASRDLVDAMENSGGESVMKEAIREVDRALDDARVEMGKAAAKKAHANRQIQMVGAKLEELTSKAKFAVDQNREELAEAAIARQVDFEAQILSSKARARTLRAKKSGSRPALPPWLHASAR